MKQRLILILALIVLLVTLIGLNAASYVQKEKIPDSEQVPNRSTFNAGATGTRAFYDLLAETGQNITRWQESFPKDSVFDPLEFSTFVIIGKTRREIKPAEAQRILDWVSNGGTLVVIDREPDNSIIATSSYWDITRSTPNLPTYEVDPSDQKDMVGESEAVKPILPSLLTSGVNAVQPSKFASSIVISRLPGGDDAGEEDGVQSDESETIEIQKPDSQVLTDNEDVISVDDQETDEESEVVTDTSILAPVVHLANSEKNILVDFPFGDGQIIQLSDPFIVSNGGIKMVDNAQIGINIVTSRWGRIAFDEYHQGYGNNDSRLLGYFSGTPVISIFLQLGLILGLIFFSQSRRFGRSLPDAEPDRLTKLEYVSAMALLQKQTKAYDLAIENIYGDFRRRVARLLGIDNKNSKREVLAAKISERTGRDQKKLEELFYKCEDIMHGEPTSKREVVSLTGKLREIEKELGIGRRDRRN